MNKLASGWLLRLPDGGGAMRSFLAVVLSVIAVGVMLIAYGLLNPRTPALADPGARPGLAGARAGLRGAAVDAGYSQYPASVQNAAYLSSPAVRPVAYPANEVRQAPVYETAP